MPFAGPPVFGFVTVKVRVVEPLTLMFAGPKDFPRVSGFASGAVTCPVRIGTIGGCNVLQSGAMHMALSDTIGIKLTVPPSSVSGVRKLKNSTGVHPRPTVPVTTSSVTLLLTPLGSRKV